MNAVDYIHSLKTFGKKAGLDNIGVLLEKMGNPHKSMEFIHIAGTNGKGSVSSMLNSILIANDKKVGLFTSPFIECFNERICVNNEPISDEALQRITFGIKPIVEEMSLDGLYCTVFDVICAVGFAYFKECNCDVVVLEVGLGGRFDSTNIIENPLCSVICAIGYDHMQYLGDTLDKIAFEKCGIIKDNCPTVAYPLQEVQVFEVIERICREKKSNLTICDISKLETVNTNLKGAEFNYKGETYHINLAGLYQVYNAVCAIETALLCGVQTSIIKKGLKEAKWKCRFEVFEAGDKTVVLDGAHNSHGISAFLESAKTLLEDKKVHYIFSILNEKDIEKSCEIMASVSGHITVTSVPSERCIDAKEVYECISKLKDEADYISDNKMAFLTAMQSDCDAVCVLGSLYTVGSMRKFVEMFLQNDKTI